MSLAGCKIPLVSAFLRPQAARNAQALGAGRKSPLDSLIANENQYQYAPAVHRDGEGKPSASGCTHTRLAENGIGCVEVCACGGFRVHLGALTLRFAPEAISELVALLGQALAAASMRRLSLDASGGRIQGRSRGSA